MNSHLNLYHFFNNNEIQFYEDNLSRAFAICLKNDGMFLDHVLRAILEPSLYKQHVSIDHPDSKFEIDLQVKAKTLEGFQRIVAVACSVQEISSFEECSANESDGNITDVCLKLNETCIIFEFKRTTEDCGQQLLNQAHEVQRACEGDATITTIDLCWSKIVVIALRVLSIQKQLSTENPFTRDMIGFLESKHPEWFPERCLISIPFPTAEDDPNHHYLDSRLKQVVSQICKENPDSQVLQIGGRYTIGVNFGWASEVSVSYECDNQGEHYLTINIWPGDTRGQGWSLYKQGQEISWPDSLSGYELTVGAYLKFSHFNKGIFWVEVDNKQSKQTHSYDFFINSTGRSKREDWDKFDNSLKQTVPDWKDQKDWRGNTFLHIFEKSERKYFDVSAGFRVRVKIPYKQAQKMDNTFEDSTLPVEVQNIIEAIRSVVDTESP